MNTENNKIIAKFSGRASQLNMTEHELTQEYIADDEMEYHCSWDWLMPVVKKIREIVNVEMSIDEFDDHRGLEQRLNPYTYDIESIHKGVVEFINWYNENK